MDRGTLQRLEQVAAWAWPALETLDVDGWLWRASGGASKRANSVLALGWRGRDVEASVAQAERLYAGRKASAQFNASDVCEPAGLERVLDWRGYRIEEPVTTMVKAVDVHARAPADAHAAQAPDDGWMATYTSVLTDGRRPMAPRLVARVPGPRAFLACVRGGRTLSSGLGAVKDGLCVIECMATLTDARRQGGAQAVLRGIEAFAAARGARLMFLQVVSANAPAIALYAGMGFRPVMSARYYVLPFPHAGAGR